MADRDPATHRVIWTQVRHNNRTFWRNPLSAFYTAGFPLTLLLILGLLFGGEHIIPGETWVGEAVPGSVPFAQVITPAIAAYAVAMAGYVHVAGATAADRADGTLKRLRGTPLPPWAYLAGRITTAIWLAVLTAVLVVLAGALFTDMVVPWRGVPAAVVTTVVGAVAFAALGLMLVSLIRPGSVQAVAFATLLPLAFVSEIFIQEPLPSGVSTVASVFPLRHLGISLREALNPDVAGAGFNWPALAVIAAWGIAAAIIAAMRFSWDPAPAGRRRPQLSRA